MADKLKGEQRRFIQKNKPLFMSLLQETIMQSIDDFDRKILHIVQNSNRTTVDIISESVNLSPAAIHRRLKRLRDTGVIKADVSIVSQQAIGRHLTIIAQIKMERETLELMLEFKKNMSNSIEVQQCYYVTGPYDFIVILTMTDMAEYEVFSQTFFSANKNIKSFETNVVMDRVKTSLYIPVDNN